jgi:hypothetical protein
MPSLVPMLTQSVCVSCLPIGTHLSWVPIGTHLNTNTVTTYTETYSYTYLVSNLPTYLNRKQGVASAI